MPSQRRSQLQPSARLTELARAWRLQVYGDPAAVPVKEDFPVSATNPYGRTKLFIEQILRDLYKSDNTWNIVLLRYFNPVGALAP